jgi:hypothetical protein
VIAVVLSYDDSVTGRSYWQEWYWQWPGVQDGQFVNAFFHVSAVEARRIKEYAFKHGFVIPPP